MPLLRRIRRWLAKTNPQSRLAAARAAVDEDDDAEAHALYSPILELNHAQVGLPPAEFGALLSEIAECSFRLGKLSEAEGICRRALSETGITRHTGAIYFRLAKIVAAQGKHDDAAALLHQSVEAQRKAFGARS